jgi:Seryl-tRNA synthetase
MLQIAEIRRDPEAIKEALSKRGLQANQAIDDLLKLDEQRRQNQSDLDQVLAEANRLSKEIGILFKSGRAEEAKAHKTESTRLKERSKELQQNRNSLSMP